MNNSNTNTISPAQSHPSSGRTPPLVAATTATATVAKDEGAAASLSLPSSLSSDYLLPPRECFDETNTSLRRRKKVERISKRLAQMLRNHQEQEEEQQLLFHRSAGQSSSQEQGQRQQLPPMLYATAGRDSNTNATAMGHTRGNVGASNGATATPSTAPPPLSLSQPPAAVTALPKPMPLRPTRLWAASIRPIPDLRGFHYDMIWEVPLDELFLQMDYSQRWEKPAVLTREAAEAMEGFKKQQKQHRQHQQQQGNNATATTVGQGNGRTVQENSNAGVRKGGGDPPRRKSSSSANPVEQLPRPNVGSGSNGKDQEGPAANNNTRAAALDDKGVNNAGASAALQTTSSGGGNGVVIGIRRRKGGGGSAHSSFTNTTSGEGEGGEAENDGDDDDHDTTNTPTHPRHQDSQKRSGGGRGGGGDSNVEGLKKKRFSFSKLFSCCRSCEAAEDEDASNRRDSSSRRRGGGGGVGEGEDGRTLTSLPVVSGTTDTSASSSFVMVSTRGLAEEGRGGGNNTKPNKTTRTPTTTAAPTRGSKYFASVAAVDDDADEGGGVLSPLTSGSGHNNGGDDVEMSARGERFTGSAVAAAAVAVVGDASPSAFADATYSPRGDEGDVDADDHQVHGRDGATDRTNKHSRSASGGGRGRRESVVGGGAAVANNASPSSSSPPQPIALLSSPNLRFRLPTPIEYVFEGGAPSFPHRSSLSFSISGGGGGGGGGGQSRSHQHPNSLSSASLSAAGGGGMGRSGSNTAVSPPKAFPSPTSVARTRRQNGSGGESAAPQPPFGSTSSTSQQQGNNNPSFSPLPPQFPTGDSYAAVPCHWTRLGRTPPAHHLPATRRLMDGMVARQPTTTTVTAVTTTAITPLMSTGTDRGVGRGYEGEDDDQQQEHLRHSGVANSGVSTETAPSTVAHRRQGPQRPPQSALMMGGVGVVGGSVVPTHFLNTSVQQNAGTNTTTAAGPEGERQGRNLQLNSSLEAGEEEENAAPPHQPLVSVLPRGALPQPPTATSAIMLDASYCPTIDVGGGGGGYDLFNTPADALIAAAAASTASADNNAMMPFSASAPSLASSAPHPNPSSPSPPLLPLGELAASSGILPYRGVRSQVITIGDMRLQASLSWSRHFKQGGMGFGPHPASPAHNGDATSTRGSAHSLLSTLVRHHNRENKKKGVKATRYSAPEDDADLTCSAPHRNNSVTDNGGGGGGAAKSLLPLFPSTSSSTAKGSKKSKEKDSSNDAGKGGKSSKQNANKGAEATAATNPSSSSRRGKGAANLDNDNGGGEGGDDDNDDDDAAYDSSTSSSNSSDPFANDTLSFVIVALDDFPSAMNLHNSLGINSAAVVEGYQRSMQQQQERYRQQQQQQQNPTCMLPPLPDKAFMEHYAAERCFMQLIAQGGAEERALQLSSNDSNTNNVRGGGDEDDEDDARRIESGVLPGGSLSASLIPPHTTTSTSSLSSPSPSLSHPYSCDSYGCTSINKEVNPYDNAEIYSLHYADTMVDEDDDENDAADGNATDEKVGGEATSTAATGATQTTRQAAPQRQRKDSMSSFAAMVARSGNASSTTAAANQQLPPLNGPMVHNAAGDGGGVGGGGVDGSHEHDLQQTWERKCSYQVELLSAGYSPSTLPSSSSSSTVAYAAKKRVAESTLQDMRRIMGFLDMYPMSHALQQCVFDAPVPEGYHGNRMEETISSSSLAAFALANDGHQNNRSPPPTRFVLRLRIRIAISHGPSFASQLRYFYYLQSNLRIMRALRVREVELLLLIRFKQRLKMLKAQQQQKERKKLQEQQRRLGDSNGKNSVREAGNADDDDDDDEEGPVRNAASFSAPSGDESSAADEDGDDDKQRQQQRHSSNNKNQYMDPSFAANNGGEGDGGHVLGGNNTTAVIDDASPIVRKNALPITNSKGGGGASASPPNLRRGPVPYPTPERDTRVKAALQLETPQKEGGGALSDGTAVTVSSASPSPSPSSIFALPPIAVVATREAQRAFMDARLATVERTLHLHPLVSTHHGRTGLYNHGITCFVNTIMQILFHSGVFRWDVGARARPILGKVRALEAQLRAKDAAERSRASQQQRPSNNNNRRLPPPPQNSRRTAGLGINSSSSDDDDADQAGRRVSEAATTAAAAAEKAHTEAYLLNTLLQRTVASLADDERDLLALECIFRRLEGWDHDRLLDAGFRPVLMKMVRSAAAAATTATADPSEQRQVSIDSFTTPAEMVGTMPLLEAMGLPPTQQEDAHEFLSFRILPYFFSHLSKLYTIPIQYHTVLKDDESRVLSRNTDVLSGLPLCVLGCPTLEEAVAKEFSFEADTFPYQLADETAAAANKKGGGGGEGGKRVVEARRRVVVDTKHARREENNPTNNDSASNTTRNSTKSISSSGLIARTLPPILMMHVKRFDAYTRKIHVRQRYPFLLDAADAIAMADHLGGSGGGGGGVPFSSSSPSASSDPYVLYAVVAHHGNKADSGHYTCYIRTPTATIPAASRGFLSTPLTTETTTSSSSSSSSSASPSRSAFEVFDTDVDVEACDARVAKSIISMNATTDEKGRPTSSDSNNEKQKKKKKKDGEEAAMGGESERPGTGDVYFHYDDEVVHPVTYHQLHEHICGTHWYCPSSSAYILWYVQRSVWRAMRSVLVATHSCGVQQHSSDLVVVDDGRGSTPQPHASDDNCADGLTLFNRIVSDQRRRIEAILRLPRGDIESASPQQQLSSAAQLPNSPSNNAHDGRLANFTPQPQENPSHHILRAKVPPPTLAFNNGNYLVRSLEAWHDALRRHVRSQRITYVDPSPAIACYYYYRRRYPQHQTQGKRRGKRGGGGGEEKMRVKTNTSGQRRDSKAKVIDAKRNTSTITSQCKKTTTSTANGFLDFDCKLQKNNDNDDDDGEGSGDDLLPPFGSESVSIGALGSIGAGDAGGGDLPHESAAASAKAGFSTSPDVIVPVFGTDSSPLIGFERMSTGAGNEGGVGGATAMHDGKALLPLGKALGIGPSSSGGVGNSGESGEALHARQSASQHYSHSRRRSERVLSASLQPCDVLRGVDAILKGLKVGSSSDDDDDDGDQNYNTPAVKETRHTHRKDAAGGGFDLPSTAPLAAVTTTAYGYGTAAVTTTPARQTLTKERRRTTAANDHHDAAANDVASDAVACSDEVGALPSRRERGDATGMVDGDAVNDGSSLRRHRGDDPNAIVGSPTPLRGGEVNHNTTHHQYGVADVSLNALAIDLTPSAATRHLSNNDSSHRLNPPQYMAREEPSASPQR